MDVIFDIDGTLADASHRLHFIKDMRYWRARTMTEPVKPDWDSFLSDELVAKDAPIKPMFRLMKALLEEGNRIIFITGRKESTRQMTEVWLTEGCLCRQLFASAIRARIWPMERLPIYMRSDGDRRPSEVVKEEGLMRARADGFDPVMVFEDRKSDAEMWRRNGLLCCQVAEGNY